MNTTMINQLYFEFAAYDHLAESLVAEVGYKSASDVPPHVKDAMRLFDGLYRADKTPWKPRAWKNVMCNQFLSDNIQLD